MYTSITVGQVLQTKGTGCGATTHACHTIGPEKTAYEALEIMADKDIGALLVVENGKLVGVFSERDYARKVILKGKSSKNTTVRELMTGSPISVGPGTTLNDGMVIMSKNNIRHLPVLENGLLQGVVTMRDVVNTIISEQETTIEDLKNYIGGNEYRI